MCGATAGGRLEVARAEKEKSEHADRIEVDLARARDRGPGARGEAKRQAERDRRVEAEAPLGGLAHRAGKEGGARKNENRKRNEQARPTHYLRCLRSDLVDVGGKCIHHYLHRAEGCDEKP